MTPKTYFKMSLAFPVVLPVVLLVLIVGPQVLLPGHYEWTADESGFKGLLMRSLVVGGPIYLLVFSLGWWMVERRQKGYMKALAILPAVYLAVVLVLVAVLIHPGDWHFWDTLWISMAILAWASAYVALAQIGFLVLRKIGWVADA